MNANDHIATIREARAADRHPMTTAEIQANVERQQAEITAAANALPVSPASSRRSPDGGLARERSPWLL